MIDAHAHLHFDVFDDDLVGALQRAHGCGVEHVVVAGYDSARRAQLHDLLRLSSPVPCSICDGVHPWAVDAMGDATLARELDLLARAAHAEEGGARDWAAVGECGLDYASARSGAQRALQREALVFQLRLAAELDLPVVVHGVRCHDDLLGILRAHTPERGGLLHAWAGPEHMIDHMVELGFFFSFGGPLTWAGHKRVKQSLAAIHERHPGRWMLETDAPSRPVASERAGRGEPAHIPEVAQAAAALLGEELEEIARITTVAARACFALEE